MYKRQTETTCLSSIWVTDEKIEEFYEIHGRKEAYRKLEPGSVAYYDGMVTVDPVSYTHLSWGGEESGSAAEVVSASISVVSTSSFCREAVSCAAPVSEGEEQPAKKRETARVRDTTVERDKFLCGEQDRTVLPEIRSVGFILDAPFLKCSL